MTDPNEIWAGRRRPPHPLIRVLALVAAAALGALLVVALVGPAA